MTDDRIKKKATMVLSTARAILRNRAPYMSALVYGFVPYFVDDLTEKVGGPIATTEGMVLAVDPVWAASLDPEIMAGCILHEGMHQVRLHLPRIAKLEDHQLGNLGGDLAINPDLLRAGWKMPEWIKLPAMYGLDEGLTLEKYYELLKPKKQKAMAGAGIPSDDDGGDGEAGSGFFDQGKIGAGGCGGCAGNPLNPELEKELDKIAGRDKAETNQIRNQAVKDIKRHIQAYGKGSVPGDFSELIELKLKKPVVPWRLFMSRILRRVTGQVVAGRSDFSLRRPSKRSNLRGIIRPGMIDRKPIIALVEDTSGSMGTSQIQAARTEEIGIFRQLGIDMAWLLQVDAALCIDPKYIRLRDIPALQTHGRGGTSFVPGIEAIQKLRPKPDIAVYLTDGDGDAPPRPPPGIVVVWCIVPTPYGRKPANWGHIVVVSDDQELREPYGV